MPAEASPATIRYCSGRRPWWSMTAPAGSHTTDSALVRDLGAKAAARLCVAALL